MFYVHAVLDWIGITLEWAAALAIIGAGVYLALFPPGGVPAFRNVGVILIAAGVGCALILVGEYLGRQACAQEKLQAEVNQRNRELKIWQGSEKTAQALNDEIDNQSDEASKQDATFLKTLTPSAACALTADQLRGLRSIH